MMKNITRRNVHQALYAVAERLKGGGAWSGCMRDGGPQVVLQGSTCITYLKPDEVATFDPDVCHNPMARWTGCLEWFGRLAAGGALKAAVRTLKEGRCAAILIEEVGTLHLVSSGEVLEGLLTGASVEAYSELPVCATRCSLVMQHAAKALGVSLGPLSHTVLEVFAQVDEDPEADLTTVLDRRSTSFKRPYEAGQVTPFELCQAKTGPWLRELSTYMSVGCEGTYTDPFFVHVVDPIVQAYAIVGGTQDPRRWSVARDRIRRCLATDLRYWFDRWLARREVEEEHAQEA